MLWVRGRSEVLVVVARNVAGFKYWRVSVGQTKEFQFYPTGNEELTTEGFWVEQHEICILEK